MNVAGQAFAGHHLLLVLVQIGVARHDERLDDGVGGLDAAQVEVEHSGRDQFGQRIVYVAGESFFE